MKSAVLALATLSFVSGMAFGLDKPDEEKKDGSHHTCDKDSRTDDADQDKDKEAK